MGAVCCPQKSQALRDTCRRGWCTWLGWRVCGGPATAPGSWALPLHTFPIPILQSVGLTRPTPAATGERIFLTLFRGFGCQSPGAGGGGAGGGRPSAALATASWPAPDLAQKRGWGLERVLSVACWCRAGRWEGRRQVRVQRRSSSHRALASPEGFSLCRTIDNPRLLSVPQR